MNWVEDYLKKNEKLPEVPDYLKPILVRPTDKISKGMKVIAPSGQFWTTLSSTRKQEWREMVEWLGENPDDYLDLMRLSSPKA